MPEMHESCTRLNIRVVLRKAHTHTHIYIYITRVFGFRVEGFRVQHWTFEAISLVDLSRRIDDKNKHQERD